MKNAAAANLAALAALLSLKPAAAAALDSDPALTDLFVATFQIVTPTEG